MITWWKHYLCLSGRQLEWKWGQRECDLRKCLEYLLEPRTWNFAERPRWKFDDGGEQWLRHPSVLEVLKNYMTKGFSQQLASCFCKHLETSRYSKESLISQRQLLVRATLQPLRLHDDTNQRALPTSSTGPFCKDPVGTSIVTTGDHWQIHFVKRLRLCSWFHLGGP